MNVIWDSVSAQVPIEIYLIKKSLNQASKDNN